MLDVDEMDKGIAGQPEEKDWRLEPPPKSLPSATSPPADTAAKEPPPPEPVLEYDTHSSEREHPGHPGTDNPAGRVCSILSIIFGGVAFLLFPPFFGVAGLTLGIIGTVLSRNKVLGIVGISVSAVGMIIGMILGAMVTSRHAYW
jgi:hypothetical protein